MKNRKRTKLFVLLLTVAPVTLMPAYATAPEEFRKSSDAAGTRVTLMRDSSSERSPATTVFPQYPTIARRDRIEGEATVCFDIDTRGKVKRAKVESYSHKIFKKPALRAIRKSNFESLRPNQVLARTKICRTYRFRLDPILAEESTS